MSLLLLTAIRVTEQDNDISLCEAHGFLRMGLCDGGDYEAGVVVVVAVVVVVVVVDVVFVVVVDGDGGRDAVHALCGSVSLIK